MHEEFWQARWARNEIGFHLKEVNPHLQACWAQLAVPAGSEVLVPLCGKSLDMPWLAAQGQRVLGIELAAKAVTDFFAEQGLAPAVRADGALQRHEDAGIAVRQGDFFAVEPAQTAGCTAFYDRAALIALPAEMRRRYVAQLQRLLPAGAVGMLVTLDYPQEQMSGPPFAVDDAEVRALYGEGWELELLLCSDALEGNWRFIERGLSRLEERVYRLRRRG